MGAGLVMGPIPGSADVAIVGAGPAGSALALRLARTGHDVLILERARFPRDKPCGDCVNPGAVEELGRLGLAETLAAELRPVPLRGWRVEAPGGGSFRAEFSVPGGRPVCGWAIRRRDLDAALLRAAVEAGARVKFGCRVFDLVRRGNRVTGVRFRAGSRVDGLDARVVVGADGLRSVVRRRLELQTRPARLRKLALVAHLRQDGHGNGFGELRVRDGFCCGYAPLARGANLSLVVPAAEASRIGGDRGAYLRVALSRFPEVRTRALRVGLEGEPLVTGPFDCPVRRPHAPGVLLVGDAAGYYDPFTGQGIYRALRSAALAAEAVSVMLGARDAAREAAGRADYGRRLARMIRPGRAVQRVIEAVNARPRLMSWFVDALARGDGGPARQLIRVTGDLQSPISLALPSFWLSPWYPAGR